MHALIEDLARFAGLVPAIVAVIAVAGLGRASAQTVTGALAGQVADASGARLPGVTIQVINRERATMIWEGVTGADGTYLATALPSGVYDIGAAHAGFATVVTRGVTLQVDQRVDVDFMLSVGSVDVTVDVDGDRLGQLDTRSASLGLVVTSTQLRALPLPSRAVLNLLSLSGGVSAGGPANGLNSAQLSINGSRTLNTEFTVDGMSVISGATGVPTRLPSVEALREFKVQTSSYSAEYGRTSGGFISVIVNSGTNRYRGSGYEYFRHEALNANDFFRVLRGEPKTLDRANQFGGTFGGPVRLPHLYDGRQRTFVFFNYEGLRRHQPWTQTSTLPDAAFRQGDFSATPIAVLDPQTGAPFPGNVIPTSRIDPAAARILSLLPLPNATGTRDVANGRDLGNFIYDATLVPANDEETVRVDHQIGLTDRIFARLTAYHLEQPALTSIPGPLDPALGAVTTRGLQLGFGWTHVQSPALLFEASGGIVWDDPRVDPPSLGLDVANTLGIARAATNASPRFNITGYSGLGLNENTLRRQRSTVYQTTGTATVIRGGHTVKAGAQLRLNRFDVFNPGANFAGVYAFNGEVTSPTRNANPVNALADFLLGRIQTALYELPQPSTERRNANVGLFVQDDWRIAAKLALNLGLRYEYESPLVIGNDVYSRIDPATGRLLAAGRNASRSLDLRPDRLNFAPRIGAVYALSDRTVLRAATGVFYGQTFSNLGGVVLYPGFTVRQTFADLGVGVAQPFTLSEGHPLTAVQNLGDPFRVERDATPASPLAASAQFGSIAPLPSIWQWNAGIQREIGAGTTLDVNYVGSRGRHLPLSRPFNQVPYEEAVRVVADGSALASQLARPFSSVAGSSSFVNDGSSSYHALQVGARRRAAAGLGMIATYTWSRAEDDGSGLFTFSQPYGLDSGQFVAQFPGINRARSAFDRPHVLVAAATYEARGPKWLHGTQGSLIVSARSGLPDTITQTSLHPDAGQQRPNVRGDNVGAFAASRTREGVAIRYLLPTTDPDFPFSPTGPFFTGSGAARRLVLAFEGPGSLGRNTTREPYEVTVDAAIGRRVPLGGTAGLTLRVEVFNLFNRVNLNGPERALSVALDQVTGEAVFNSPTFGLITSAKPARSMQLVARLDF